MANTLKQTRKVLRVNQEGLLRHLKVIATHGLFEQGSEKALAVGREIFYWQKGTEKTPLSLQEVSQQIQKL